MAATAEDTRTAFVQFLFGNIELANVMLLAFPNKREKQEIVEKMLTEIINQMSTDLQYPARYRVLYDTVDGNGQFVIRVAEDLMRSAGAAAESEVSEAAALLAEAEALVIDKMMAS